MKNITIALLILASVTSCKTQQEDDDAAATSKDSTQEKSNFVTLTKGQFETAGIETGTASIRNLSDVVTANGNIDIPPQNLVSISAPMGGFVRKTDLLQGMHVKKGQVLATVENKEFIQIQQDYLETEGKLEYAQLEFTRQSELSKENVNAQKVLQQSVAEVKTQKARLAGLTEKLITAGIDLKVLKSGTIVNSSVILSPISGSVTTVNVNLGKYVTPTDVMFEIVDTHHLHVELSIFEQDIPKIKLGQLVRFTVTNNPSLEHEAEVYLINQKINEDRTVRVHCHLRKDDPNLLPQNFVKAIIETGANPVTALPDQAIVDFEDKSYVFVERVQLGNETKSNPGLHFEMKQVIRGVSENGFSQIRMADGTDVNKFSVVLKGSYALLSKLKNSEEEE